MQIVKRWYFRDMQKEAEECKMNSNNDLNKFLVS